MNSEKASPSRYPIKGNKPWKSAKTPAMKNIRLFFSDSPSIVSPSVIESARQSIASAMPKMKERSSQAMSKIVANQMTQ